MTDITALVLLVSKAKASVFTLEYISQFEAADIDSDDVDLRFEVDGVETGTNVSIVDECGQAAQMIKALVEALEKAQQHEQEWRSLCEAAAVDLDNWCEIDDKSRGLICKMADSIIALHERIAELESRTVTVKLPKPTHHRANIGTGEWFTYDADDVDTALAAAGIQVIEGEQKNG